MSVQCATFWERAGKVFGADGTLLARLVPPALVREVLEQAQVVSRTRRTSALLGVYLVLAMTLFPEMSMLGVFETLTGTWGRPGAAVPTASSLKERKARLGVGPFQELFARLRSAGASVTQATWKGMLLCAWDGTTLEAPDTQTNEEVFPKAGNQHGKGGFPQIRLLLLVACGTRAVIDAAVDSTTVGENKLALRLLGSLRPGMLLLADRNFPGYALWCHTSATEADLLWRMKRNITLTKIQALPDGSYLARWKATKTLTTQERATLPAEVLVRVIEGWITVIDADGVRRSERYQLVTTLTDYRKYPAKDLIKLYGRRWQVELMIKGLKCVQGAARLRSKTPAGVLQETWAWLCTHQLLRLEAANAAEHAAGPVESEVSQISFTALVRRFRTAAACVGRDHGSADKTLSELREVTREDVTPIDTRVRVCDRVVKHPVARFPAKKPHHTSRTVVYEYTIEPAHDPAANPPESRPVSLTSADTPQSEPAPTMINS